jgi:hypothetical protein
MCAFFSGLQFSALWSRKLLLYLLQILPLEIDGIMAGYCVTLRSLIYLHQFVGITIWYPNLCVFLSRLLLSMALFFFLIYIEENLYLTYLVSYDFGTVSEFHVVACNVCRIFFGIG